MAERLSNKYHCLVCEQEEAHCTCALKEYCGLCQGQEDVRLCEDGLYYCAICREACDLQAQY